MTDAREFLNRIAIKPPEPPRKPPRRSVSTCPEQHTLEFVTAEAGDRNMTPGEFIRHILELLESGDF